MVGARFAERGWTKHGVVGLLREYGRSVGLWVCGGWLEPVAELGFQFRGGKIKRKNILNMLINNKLTITK